MSSSDIDGPPEGLMWAAGVDYVRYTWTGEGDEMVGVADRYHNLAAWAGHLADPDARAEAWSAMGYKGLAWASAAYGTRSDGAMYQVSGAAAHEAFLLGAPHTNVSRLDIQVTVWFSEASEDVPGHVRRQALRARAGRRGKPFKVTFVDGCGDGDTCYVGSRHSDSYIRVYDKGAETGEDAYAGAVRYEVELKGALAAQEASQLDTAIGEAELYCCQTVRAYLADRGISLPVRLQTAPISRRHLVAEKPSNVRRLVWLQRQVSPTVRGLIEGGVSEVDVFLALFGRAQSPDELARLDNLVCALYYKGRTSDN